MRISDWSSDVCSSDLDAATHAHANDPHAELDALLAWIGPRVGRPSYRGCPQNNVAAEFPDGDHPARKVATAHKREMRRRLTAIEERLGVSNPTELGGQLAVPFNGAFIRAPMLREDEATDLLQRASRALVAGSTSPG